MIDDIDETLCQKLCDCKTVVDGKKRFLMAIQLWLSKYTCE